MFSPIERHKVQEECNLSLEAWARPEYEISILDK